MRVISFFLMFLFGGWNLRALDREWVNNSGRKVMGELISYADGTVNLKTKSGVFAVPLSTLSAADQAFVLEWVEAENARDKAGLVWGAFQN